MLTGKEFLDLEHNLELEAKHSDMMCYAAQTSLTICELVRHFVLVLRCIEAKPETACEQAKAALAGFDDVEPIEQPTPTVWRVDYHRGFDAVDAARHPLYPTEWDGTVFDVPGRDADEAWKNFLQGCEPPTTRKLYTRIAVALQPPDRPSGRRTR